MRPLTPREEAERKGKLREAERDLARVQSYVSRLERELTDGTWYEDPEEAKHGWERAEEVAAKHRKLTEERKLRCTVDP